MLIISGEHYGAVLNRDFDYVRYPDTLPADHLNLTRVFSGSYREVPGNFAIASNTLAPAPGKFVAPWWQVDGKFEIVPNLVRGQWGVTQNDGGLIFRNFNTDPLFANNPAIAEAHNGAMNFARAGASVLPVISKFPGTSRSPPVRNGRCEALV